MAVLFALLILPTTSGFVRSVAGKPELLALGWDGVVQQSSTNTCGPAVIATLLSWRGQVVTEEHVAAAADLSDVGMTLAEFGRLATEFGFPGRWFRNMGRGSLAELPAPSVVHLDRASGHFAIFLGTVGRYVQLADPARGRVFIPRGRFLEKWTGRTFMFYSDIDIPVGSGGERRTE